jgi:hypothetical protein
MPMAALLPPGVAPQVVLSKAEAMLQRAIEIDPQCANAHKYLGKIAVARQRQETSKSQQLTSNVQLLPQKALNDAITERAITKRKLVIRCTMN